MHAVQIGSVLKISFTLPLLATDGERLSKPVEVQIFRSMASQGQQPSLPSTKGAAWATILPDQIPGYKEDGKIVYSDQLSAPEFRARIGSIFAFSVVTLTRGFRRHAHMSEPSNIAEVRLIDVTEAPQDLTIEPSQTTLHLHWSKPVRTVAGAVPSHLAGYEVDVSSTGKPGSFHLLGRPSSNECDDSSFEFGQLYVFQVSAVSAVNGTRAESTPSGSVSIRPRDTFPPGVPTGLTAVYTAAAVDLLWNADTDSDLTGYNVYRSSSGESFERVNAQPLRTPIFHDSSATAGKTYRYAVTAVDTSGNESARSQAATIATSR